MEWWKRKWKSGLTGTENLATDGKGKKPGGHLEAEMFVQCQIQKLTKRQIRGERNCWGRARRWKSDDWEPGVLFRGGSFDFSNFITFYIESTARMFIAEQQQQRPWHSVHQYSYTVRSGSQRIPGEFPGKCHLYSYLANLMMISELLSQSSVLLLTCSIMYKNQKGKMSIT